MTSPPPPTHTSPRRKIIVVLDACSIKNAAVPIPENYFIEHLHEKGYLPPHRRPTNFLDLYSQMPAERVKGIHIPDLVYAEVRGQEHGTGEVVSRNSPNSPDYDAIGKFFKNPRVKVRRTERGQELIELLLHLERAQASMDRIVAKQSDAIQRNKQAAASEQWANIIRKKIRNIFLSDEGERIMGEYIATLKENPVLFITDDYKGLDIIASFIGERSHEIPARGVNTMGFLKILRDAKILESMGIKPSITDTDMFKTMMQLRDRSSRDFVRGINSVPRSILVYSDSPAETLAKFLTSF